VPQLYVPMYAARDAMKSFCPAGSCDAETEWKSRIDGGEKERKRQDSVVPEVVGGIDGTKPLKACVEEGLVPDHRDDTWSAVWETAYEERRRVYHCDSRSASSFHFPSVTPASSTSTSPSTTSTSTSSTTQTRRSSRSSRPPLTGRLSVTDAEIKAFVFGTPEQSRKRSHESPEAFLRPRGERRGSEVPSLVFSEGSCGESGLEDLEEVEEQAEEEGIEGVRSVSGGRDGKDVGDGRDVWWEIKAEKRVGKVRIVPAILDAEVV
jgi:hypothetical protein